MSEPRTFLDGRVTLHAGDCRDVLRGMADNSVDSVVTDPPYHLTSIVKRFGSDNAKPVKSNLEQPADKNLDGINAGAFRRLAKGFMGKQWDGGDIAFQTDLWAEVLRVLKPGGYIMAFSGCRTYHRMACAIEDAGFITHPMFAWMFGSGFPKAHSVSKQIDRLAGVARTEIIRRGRAAISGKDKTKAWSTSLGSDYDITAPATDAAREWDGWFYGAQSLKPAIETIYFGQKPFERGLNGAQTVQKWGVGAVNIAACKIPTDEDRSCNNNARGDGTSYIIQKEAKFIDPGGIGRWPANLIHDGSDEVLACFPESSSSRSEVTSKPGDIYGNGAGLPSHTGIYGIDDSGSAARFFYTAKADADDRLGSKHPTVKPLDLIQYLVRLITPPKGVCLDLFAGTGTTAEACFREGFRSILIENDPESIADIERRMSLVMAGPNERAVAGMKARGRPRDDGPLFGGGRAIYQSTRTIDAE